MPVYARPEGAAIKPRHSLGAIFGALLLVAATPGRASLLNFDFSFAGAPSFPGTVTGEIDGLTNNATSSANAVYIDSSSSTAPFSLPFNTIEDAFSNTFTVTNGQITDLKYFAESITIGYLISLNDQNREINALIVMSPPGTIANAGGPAGLVLTPAPEPSAALLLLTALAGLLLFRPWASRSRHQSAGREAVSDRREPGHTIA